MQLATLAENRSLSGCVFLPTLKGRVSNEVLMKQEEINKLERELEEDDADRQHD